jgi:D-amino-acid oxidase
LSGFGVSTVGSVTSGEPDVLVIGAGVSGLTTAICLAEAGYAVTVAAADPPQRTTSAAAGAIWGPHLVGMDERVSRWGSLTMARLREMARDPATGVHMASGMAVSAAQQADPFDWISALDGPRPCDPEGLPAGYATGWRLAAPIVSMPVYLSYLVARLDRAGAQVREARFDSFREAAGLTSAAVIVNCSGIGAHGLVPDREVMPVRGQVVIVENPGISEFFVGVGREPDEVTYYFPHGDVVVLGGTEEAGDWSREPDPAIAERILDGCAAVEPRLRGATVTEHRVGLRPVRPSVRLEAESLDGGPRLVHNYGHGGAGVTLSWGCALEVAALVAATPSARPPAG